MQEKQKNLQKITTLITDEQYQWLHEQAFQHDIKLASLFRKAIDLLKEANNGQTKEKEKICSNIWRGYP